MATGNQRKQAPEDASDWESMKSELDVAKEQVLDGRQKLHFVVRRRLEDFGSSANFTDLNSSTVSTSGASTSGDKNRSTAEFAPYEDKSFNIHMACQFKAVSCQTDLADIQNVWTQYSARQFSEAESNEILQSKSMADFMLMVEPRLHEALEQAEIVDAFADDFNAFKGNQPTNC